MRNAEEKARIRAEVMSVFLSNESFTLWMTFEYMGKNDLLIGTNELSEVVGDFMIEYELEDRFQDAYQLGKIRLKINSRLSRGMLDDGIPIGTKLKPPAEHYLKQAELLEFLGFPY